MKRYIIILLALFILIMPISVAADECDATLKVDYKTDNSNNIIVDAAFVDIKAQEGIITLQYDTKYDPEVLELVKVEPVYPEEWEELLESEMVEDFSSKKSDGVYCWSFVVIEIGKGAKEDNTLGIHLEFSPKSEEKTEISIEYIDIGTEILKNGMTEALLHISGNSVKIDIDLSNPSVPEIDDTSITIPDKTPIGSTSLDDSATSEGNSDYSISNNTSEDALVSESNDSNWLFWTIIGVGAVGVIAVTVFVVKSKRGKK